MNIFKIRVFRQIYGPKIENEEYIKRIEKEIYQLFQTYHKCELQYKLESASHI